MFRGSIRTGAEQDPGLVDSFRSFGVHLKDLDLKKSSESPELSESLEVNATQNSESFNFEETLEVDVKDLGLTQNSESSKCDAAGSGFESEDYPDDFKEPEFESDVETIQKAKLKRYFIFMKLI